MLGFGKKKKSKKDYDEFDFDDEEFDDEDFDDEDFDDDDFDEEDFDDEDFDDEDFDDEDFEEVEKPKAKKAKSSKSNKTTSDDSQKRIRELEAKNERLEQELAEVQAIPKDYSKLKMERETQSHRLRELEEQVSLAQKRNERLLQKIAQYEAELNELQQAVDSGTIDTDEETQVDHEQYDLLEKENMNLRQQIATFQAGTATTALVSQVDPLTKEEIADVFLEAKAYAKALTQGAQDRLVVLSHEIDQKEAHLRKLQLMENDYQRSYQRILEAKAETEKALEDMAKLRID